MKQRITSLSISGLLVFALLGGAMAGPLEDGRAAYQRSDYGVAMRLLRSPGANNRADAQRDIGLMYAQGQGVRQDFAQALTWFRKAADQGDALAQFYLGVMYRDGNGVPKDDAQALTWYRKSADQGDARAQFDIGSMYRHGEGVPKDAAQAAAWYRKAADQGHAFAQSNLGVMYSEGDGVAKDDAQALIWFHRAADQGEAVALFNLGLAYDKGDGAPQDFGTSRGLVSQGRGQRQRRCPDQSWLLVHKRRGGAQGLYPGVHVDRSRGVATQRRRNARSRKQKPRQFGPRDECRTDRRGAAHGAWMETDELAMRRDFPSEAKASARMTRV